MKLGIDIGGTKTAAVIIDADGSVGNEQSTPTGFGPEAVVESTVSTVLRMAASAGMPVAGFESIGIGIPGAVDSDAGSVSHAVNLGLDALAIGPVLAERLGVPVRIENDVNAAAVGAYHLLSPNAEYKAMAYLNLGTGLAAGLVLDGQLWQGARGIAGEIGHIPVDPEGVLCACGQRGCLETVASGSSLLRSWPTEDPQPAHALFTAADAADPAALRVKQRFVESVAAAVRVLVLTVGVDAVVIGGGLSGLGDRLANDVRSVLAHWSDTSPFIASLGMERCVHVIPAGYPAAAVGAALIGAPPMLATMSSGVGIG